LKLQQVDVALLCFLLAQLQGFDAVNVDEAREEIFDLIRRNRDKRIIYFHGWDGFGAAPVLRSIAQELGSIKAKKTPSELCFERIIYIDCSAWESRRVMQRKIAEELELDLGTMAMLDKQDEEDDFNGVDHGSRDLIRSVSEAIAQTLVYKKLMMLFLNGSDDEVDVNKFGISPDSWGHVILWTFKRRSMSPYAGFGEIPKKIFSDNEILKKLRYTELFLWSFKGLQLQFCVLLRVILAT
jgi:hypothetical protein